MEGIPTPRRWFIRSLIVTIALLLHQRSDADAALDPGLKNAYVPKPNDTVRWNFTLTPNLTVQQLTYKIGSTNIIQWKLRPPPASLTYYDNVYLGKFVVDTQEQSTLIMKEIENSDQGLVVSLIVTDTIGTVYDAYKMTIYVEPPTISDTQTSVTAIEGSNVTLSPTVSAEPTPRVTWRFNSAEILGRGPTLTINIRKSLHGVITATISNGIGGIASLNYSLVVHYKPDSASLSASKTTICQGETITLTCAGSARPTVNIYAFYVGAALQTSSSSRTHNVTMTSPGDHVVTCVPGNDIGTDKNATVTVTVQAPPTLSAPPTSVIKVEGQSATLTCDMNGSPNPTVAWAEVGGGVFHQGPVYTIPSVTRTHEGQYTCTGSNGAVCANISASANITVHYKPDNAVIAANKAVYMKDESATFTCTASGKPQLCDIEFMQNNLMIGTKTQQMCSGQAITYVVPNIQGCNQERFSCNANNSAGETIGDAINVTVNELLAVQASPSDTIIVRAPGESLTLNCTASACPAPTEVKLMKEGQMTSLKTGLGPKISYTFENLTVGDEGQYYCRATYAQGGPATKYMNITVSAMPANTQLTPSHLTLCQNDNLTLTCSASGRPMPHEYKLYHNQALDDSNAHGVFSVTAAQAGTSTYHCTAKNTAGTGTSTDVAITAKEPPVITTFPATHSGPINLSLVMQCTSTGTPPRITTWSKQGTNFTASGDTLTLASLSAADEGIYTCTVRNGDECRNATAQTMVTVTGLPNVTTSLVVVSPTQCLGETIELRCTTTALPPIQDYKFYERNQHTDTNTGGIFRVTLASAGTKNYRCVPRKATTGDVVGGSLTVTIVDPVPQTSIVESIVEGQNYNLTCDANGRNVTWRKSGSEKYPVGHTRHFMPLNRADDGVYYCVVELLDSCATDAIKKVTLQVIYKPENTSLTQSRTVACVDDSVSLTCTTTANPAPQYKIYRYSTLVSRSRSFSQIFNVPGDLIYTCAPENTLGSGSNASVNVSVKGVVVGNRTDLTVIEDQPVTLTCNINTTGYDVNNVTWYKLGSANHYPKGPSLVFSRVARGDEGRYRCQLDIGEECPTKSEKYEIEVNYPPTIAPIIGNTTLKENATIALLCRAAGKPSPQITWTKNGSLVTGGRRTIAGLAITITATDETMGTYTCTASNTIGQTSRSTTLSLFRYTPCAADYCQDGGTCSLSDNCDRNGICPNAATVFTCRCRLGLTGERCQQLEQYDELFIGSFEIIQGLMWNESYENKNTWEYRNATSKIKTELEGLYTNRRYFVKSNILNLRRHGTEGVIVDFDLRFNQTISRSEAFEPLRRAAQNGSIGIFGINGTTVTLAAANSLDPCRSSPCLNGGTCNPSGNSAYKCLCPNFRYGTKCEDGIDAIPVIIIIVALLIILIVVTVLCLFYCKAKRRRIHTLNDHQEEPKKEKEEKKKSENKQIADHPMAAEGDIELAEETTLKEAPETMMWSDRYAKRPSDKDVTPLVTPTSSPANSDSPTPREYAEITVVFKDPSFAGSADESETDPSPQRDKEQQYKSPREDGVAMYSGDSGNVDHTYVNCAYDDDIVYSISTTTDPNNMKRSQSFNRKVRFELEGSEVDFEPERKLSDSLKRMKKVGTL